ncbi:MAG: lipopolysaccharide biosynthesis protein [Prosthecobacter sp.]
MSLARRFLTGSGLSLLDQAVKMASAFVLTPIIVSGLGTGLYGAWCMLVAVFAQYGWLDLGLSISIPRFFSKAISGKKEGEVRSLAGTAAVIFMFVAAAPLIASAVIAWRAPRWMDDPAAAEVVRSVVLVFGSFLAVQTTSQLYLGYLKAHIRYDKIAIASIVRVVLTGVLFVLVLQRGWGLLGIASVHAACGVLECLMIVTFARRLDPPLEISPRFFTRTKARELLGYSFMAYLMMAGQSLRGTMQPIIIAAQAGEAAVTGYALGTRFPTLFVDLAHIMAGGQLLNLFSRYVGENDQQGLRNAFVFASRMCAALAVLGAAMMWMFGQPFFQRWIPAHAAQAWEVLAPTVLPKALFVAQTPSMVLLLALARHSRLAVLDWIAGLGNFALTWWLASSMGGRGAAMATCIEQSLVCGILWPLLAAKVTQMSFASVWGGLLAWPVARAVLILLPCMLLLPYARPDYLNLVLIGMACSAWYGAATLLLMRNQERVWLLKLMPFLAKIGFKADATGGDAR